jgi:hypothetical protein
MELRGPCRGAPLLFRVASFAIADPSPVGFTQRADTEARTPILLVLQQPK